jgi:hypothetical protein
MTPCCPRTKLSKPSSQKLRGKAWANLREINFWKELGKMYTLNPNNPKSRCMRKLKVGVDQEAQPIRNLHRKSLKIRKNIQEITM